MDRINMAGAIGAGIVAVLSLLGVLLLIQEKNAETKFSKSGEMFYTLWWVAVMLLAGGVWGLLWSLGLKPGGPD